jgi:hypothetical protein
MSQGFWRGFVYLSARGFRFVSRAYCAFYCSYVMRCCAIHEELHLLQLWSLSFFVFRFFPSPTILIVVEGRSDTPEVSLYLRLLGWLRRAQCLL